MYALTRTSLMTKIIIVMGSNREGYTSLLTPDEIGVPPYTRKVSKYWTNE
jgi:hypothetical protein